MTLYYITYIENRGAYSVYFRVAIARDVGIIPVCVKFSRPKTKNYIAEGKIIF